MDEIIYIVEDDEGIRELYEGAFEGVFATKMFENGKDFFREFTKTRPSLIILDIMLPDMDGYTILTKIREMDEKIPVIIVSARSDEISAVKGLNKGADDYMTKPFSSISLIFVRMVYPSISGSIMSRIIRLGRAFSKHAKKSLPFSNILVRNTPSKAPSYNSLMPSSSSTI